MAVGWLIFGIVSWGVVDVAAAGDFGRQDDTLRTRRYWTVDGPASGPLRGKWRNRRGRFLVTSFSDGIVEHFDEYEGRTRTQTRVFGVDGQARATIDWPTESVVLHLAPERTVPFADWPTWRVGGIDWRAPESVVQAGLIAESADPRADLPLTLAVLATPSAEPGVGAAPYDPFAPDFSSALEKGCGCEIESRITVFVAGRPAAHFRLQRPNATADVVALPVDAQEAPEQPIDGVSVAAHPAGLLVLAAAGPDVEALVPLRAMMATAQPP